MVVVIYVHVDDASKLKTKHPLLNSECVLFSLYLSYAHRNLAI